MTRLIVALCVIGAAACAGNPAGPAEPARAGLTRTAAIISIRIVPEITTLRIGATEQFSVTTTMGPGVPPPCPSPQWSVIDPSIATATASGRVTAVSPGRTTLTLTFCGQNDSRALEVVP